MTEKRIERDACRDLQAMGCLCLKFSSRYSVGWLDRIVIGPTGVHAWIEFKAARGRLTRIQEERIRELKKRRVNVAVCRTREEAVRFAVDVGIIRWSVYVKYVGRLRSSARPRAASRRQASHR